MIAIDLHLHTTASDGTWSPQDVVREAVASNVQAIAFTDHDTMVGGHQAAPLARKLGIRMIFGVELNTDARGAEIDILGYFLDPGDQTFQAMLRARQEDRIRRARDMIAKLNDLGVHITYQRVREIAHGIVARPHIAQAVIEKGCAATQQEVYYRYIGFGAPAYAERDSLHPAQAIRCVCEAGGVPVVAHPGLIGDDNIVLELLRAGAMGLEAYYPEHSPEDVERYVKLARDSGAIVTAGSDCHGPGRKKSFPIGSIAVPSRVLSDFQACLEAAHAQHRARFE